MSDTSLSLLTALEIVALALVTIPLQVKDGTMEVVAGYDASRRCHDLKKAIAGYPRHIARERETIWREVIWLIEFLKRYTAAMEPDQKKLLADTELRFRLLIT